MTNKKSFRSLDIIFNAMIAGQVLLGFIVYYFNQSEIVEPVLADFKYLPIVVLIVNTIVILTAKYLFAKRTKIDKKISIDEKVKIYFSLSLFILALIEGANIFNLLMFLLNGSTIYLIVAVLILILFFVYRPSPDKFARDSLTGDERKQFPEQF